jgi:acyl-CoA thioester hydrolase
MDPASDQAIGVCVESMCKFAAPLGFPGVVTAKVGVGHVGTSSVRYELDLHGEEGPVASGHFVHVYVDRDSRRPVEVPPRIRTSLAELRTGSPIPG